MLIAIALGASVWALARVPLPRVLWIPLITTVALGALTLGLGFLLYERGPGVTAENPVLPMLGLMWLWRIGVLVVLAGAVVYIVHLFRSLKETRQVTA